MKANLRFVQRALAVRACDRRCTQKRVACTGRVLAGGLAVLLVAALSVACVEREPSSGDASTLVDAGGTVDDADGRASQPDLDARSVDTVDTGSPLDARLQLDATPIESGLYSTDDGGTCFVPVPDSCAPRSARSVRCGAGNCSGATPVCCRQRWSSQDVTPVCVAEGAVCVEHDGGPENDSIYNLLDQCDETSDCKADEICVDGVTKPLPPRNGGTCFATCWLPTTFFIGYSYQLCSNDCECVAGHGCVNGSCAR